MSPLVARLAAVTSLALAGLAVADPPPRVTRISAVGASVTLGYGTPVELVDVLGATLVKAPEASEGHASELFFTSPAQYAQALLDDALEGEPQVLFALDYLFWFGYGAGDSEGLPLPSEEARLDLLEEGLEYLEAVECTLVLGDFPDMSPAVGRMLYAEQVPEPETLVRLNERLRAWADERERTLVVPLFELAARVRSGESFELGRRSFTAERAAGFMQEDQLHPTREGLVALAQISVDALIEAELARPGDFDLETDAILERLGERR